MLGRTKCFSIVSWDNVQHIQEKDKSVHVPFDADLQPCMEVLFSITHRIGLLGKISFFRGTVNDDTVSATPSVKL